jgi:hypothetical protein
MTHVTDEIIERFEIDTFLPVPGLDTHRVEEAVQQLDAILTTLKEQGVRVPEQTFREQLSVLNRPMGTQPLPAPMNRPDLERKQYRLWPRSWDRPLALDEPPRKSATRRR